MLAAQRRVKQAERRRLDALLDTLGSIESALRAGRPFDVGVRCALMEVAPMNDPRDNDDWKGAYATLMALWRERRPSRVAMREMGEEWEQIVTEIQGALSRGERTASPEIGARWMAMLRRLYGDDAPLSVFVTAGRHIDKWSPSFAKWRGWVLLTDALQSSI